jgi:hypothetical protein
MIIFYGNNQSEATLTVEKSWGGYSVTGQLVKEIIEAKGSVKNIESYMKNCTVKVFFPVQLLTMMTVDMVISVLNDVKDLEASTAKVKFEWIA